MKKENNTERNPILSTTFEKICFSFGEFGCNLINGIMGFLTLYLTDNVLISGAVIGTVTLISKVLDGGSDILMGILIEKTRSRFGKARGWILWMMIPLVVVFFSLFHIPAGFSHNAKIVYYAIMLIIHFAITYTAMNMSVMTLFTLMAPDRADRNKATAFRTLFAMLASLVPGIITMPLLTAFGGVTSQAAWDKLIISYMIVVLVCLSICFFGTKEKDLSVLGQKKAESSEKMKEGHSLFETFKLLIKGKYFWLAIVMSITYYMGNSTGGINVYYARDILGDANLVGVIGIVTLPTMILGAIISPFWYNRFGKRKTMLIGSIITAAACVVQFTVASNVALFLLLIAVKGFGIMLYGSGIGTMPGEIADWSEWKGGQRAEGITSTLTSFGLKVGSGFGGALVGWSLAWGNYDGSLAVQPQSALNAEIMMMIGLPLILAVLQIIPLMLWDMDKIYPRIMKELKRDEA